jgi:hypothetical protein
MGGFFEKAAFVDPVRRGSPTAPKRLTAGFPLAAPRIGESTPSMW